jgi:MoaA/NifB/PqqE/SkfB family radical SAM enzyme
LIYVLRGFETMKGDSNFLSHIKRFSVAKFTSAALSLLSNTSDEQLIWLTYPAEKIPHKDSYKKKIRWIRELFRQKHPSLEVARRILRGSNSAQRKKIVNFLVNQFLEGTNRRKEFESRTGYYPPRAMLISPTMRCNLNCYGCYAGDHSHANELEPKLIHRVLSEAKEMGISLVVVLGGEPFLRKDLFEVYEAHPDMAFHVFTHGGFLDEKMVDTVARLGNVMPAISLEGFKDETDKRRGKGHFEKVVQSMDLLREAKVLFACSLTQAKENTDVLSSERFIDFLVAKGCILIWYFMCVPVGKNPDIGLLPTPEQRDLMREKLKVFRATKPILFVDFWNDGQLTNGCMAGGRMYFHINAKGDVEPCVFCHFASDNIRETTLLKALNSPLFQKIRSLQPYSKNLLRPCMLVDEPWVGREMAFRHAGYFTHPGAETLFSELSGQIDHYAEQYGEIADAVWEELTSSATKSLARNA